MGTTLGRMWSRKLLLPSLKLGLERRKGTHVPHLARLTWRQSSTESLRKQQLLEPPRPSLLPTATTAPPLPPLKPSSMPPSQTRPQNTTEFVQLLLLPT